MAKQPKGMEQLLMDELQDLFDAEKQLVKALPKMAKAATDEELESALRQHLEVTRRHVQRLEQVFESMDKKARSRPCKGMKGIVEEGQEILQEDQEEAVLDAAISGAARKVEHYEMMGYESARALAQQLGMKDAADLLQETLQEEMQADKTLAAISKRLVKGALRQQSSARRTPAKRSPRGGGSTARPLTDHDEIRNWAAERGAHPACVKGTGSSRDTGMIRLDFPGYSGEDSLQEISWEDWFAKFDESGLALMVQDTTAQGEPSNFNKLVSRVGGRSQSKTRTAR